MVDGWRRRGLVSEPRERSDQRIEIAAIEVGPRDAGGLSSAESFVVTMVMLVLHAVATAHAALQGALPARIRSPNHRDRYEQSLTPHRTTAENGHWTYLGQTPHPARGYRYTAVVAAARLVGHDRHRTVTDAEAATPPPWHHQLHRIRVYDSSGV
nr:hypothetical protein JVH1_8370 [Rhodococcus sp. JVH1]